MPAPENIATPEITLTFAPDFPPPRMNIYAEPGTAVLFDGRGGYEGDKKSALTQLIEGQRYLVRYIAVGGSSSTVSLVEVEGRFNTCLFAHIEETL